MRLLKFSKFLFLVLLLSCDSQGDEKSSTDGALSEALIMSMVDSWRLGIELDIQSIQVHDFSETGTLDSFIDSDGIIFLFPGDTCNPCLEREFQKFLDWETPLKKYVLGVELNSNYLLELKRSNETISDVFVAEMTKDLTQVIALPYIVFYRKITGTAIFYAAVKSDIDHFDYFKSVVGSLTQMQK